MRTSLLAAVLLIGAAPALAENPSPEARQAAFAKLPYWGGQWITENDESTIGGLPVAVVKARDEGGTPARNPAVSLFGFAAPWNDEGKRRQAARVGGNRTAQGWGFPMMMNAAAPLQFIINPEETIIINGYRDILHVRTDGSGHPGEDDMWPTVWGDSVGHWEEDTLVIDTIGVTNPNVYFHGGPPLSEDAHYVQRLRLESPGRIVGEITITDPATLAQPWVVKLSWTRDDTFGRMVYDVFTNDRTDSANGTIAPTEGQDNTEAPAETQGE